MEEGEAKALKRVRNRARGAGLGDGVGELPLADRGFHIACVGAELGERGMRLLLLNRGDGLDTG